MWFYTDWEIRGGCDRVSIFVAQVLQKSFIIRAISSCGLVRGLARRSKDPVSAISVCVVVSNGRNTQVESQYPSATSFSLDTLVAMNVMLSATGVL